MSDSKHDAVPSEPPPYTALSAGAPIKAPIQRPMLPLDLPVLNMLRGKRVILASASPRRRHLLAQIGLTNIEIIPSTLPEDIAKGSISPFEYVLQTATRKATHIYSREINNETRGEPGLIIAADTIVVSHMGEIMEKPRSEREHIAMLTQLRNWPTHKVYTAVVVMTPLESAVAPGYAMETAVEETVVTFDKMVTDELILAYVKTREGADKAGGYGIQGMGSILIEKIEGTHDNVVGLPLRTTLKCIEKVMTHDELADEFASSLEED
ncbi:hypothetical protein GP486_000804 [Trichoglossum hirsutum]|uniref:Maf-like protein n=1 Tax=Trichoglossum hirsutum TaxID=265104 RepID=A0A9P8LI88_9PEZI|nr:hypothetical protein GP486_000804 [Trichoglossum hirsutum]